MNPSRVNFNSPRKFRTTLKSKCKETFFPDDPFRKFKNEKPLGKAKKTLQYFVPIFEWLPQYNFKIFRFDLLAGITITSLAIPQGISYAKLAEIPPIIGLYSSFVPALVYTIFGSSKHVAVGTVAACSLLIADIIGSKVSSTDDPTLYLHLVFTAAFITGVFQAALDHLYLCRIEYEQTGDSGGFPVAFDDHWFHGRHSNYYLPTAIEGLAWNEAFHHQNRCGLCFACSFRKQA
ncbi:hypothetical protein OIU84_010587 [Salix udensis]|uniref:SLC26A/SulP transporter domain-containing protein n=1 Tax=Salix udensis TaxID=889485 RepID=A0AAD6JN13_9ROSI|nr:hypothetical protein OIU84_010587 [Salix udensis]